jgi:hypothetical protein
MRPRATLISTRFFWETLQKYLCIDSGCEFSVLEPFAEILQDFGFVVEGIPVRKQQCSYPFYFYAPLNVAEDGKYSFVNLRKKRSNGDLLFNPNGRPDVVIAAEFNIASVVQHSHESGALIYRAKNMPRKIVR